MTKERNELWENTLDALGKAMSEYKDTDRKSDEYSRVTDNLTTMLEKTVTMLKDDEMLEAEVKKAKAEEIKFKFERVKFWTSIGVRLLELVCTFVFGTVMLDWEQANTMTSKFWPVIQQMIPKTWRQTNTF